MRVGLLGGTFNPPHLGHLLCAQEAHAQLGLDVVLLLPARVPPHKPVEADPGPEHRFEMCRLATRDDSRLGVLRDELDRPPPSFTVDTLRALHAARPEDELTFVAGGDVARSLPSWREPEQVLALARLAVIERAGAGRAEIERALGPLAGGASASFLATPLLDVSSSDVRRRLAEGRPVRYLLPDAVADYIAQHGLYGSA